MPIVRLDEHLVNQIAAGEVIERPSSVVKELLENSIDAGSTRIRIVLEQSGLQLIQVSDNGQGIDRAEVALAFERHATSKLLSEKELFRIRTLGFRGEALPSIASVAKVSVETRTANDVEGSAYAVEGGVCQSVRPCACNVGTTIAVKDLFYNTPVRLKYVKSLQTELSHCLDVVQKLTLAHPAVAFQFVHNGKTLLQTPGDGELRHAFAALYGAETAKQMVECKFHYRDHHVNGLLGLPAVSRANRNHGFLFLNGRPIRHYGVATTVIEAYGHRLPIHRFPVYALQLKIDPSLVDVNVHPTKLEVRFSLEDELRKAVREAVEAALHQANPVPSFGAEQESFRRTFSVHPVSQPSSQPTGQRTILTPSAKEQAFELYRPAGSKATDVNMQIREAAAPAAEPASRQEALPPQAEEQTEMRSNRLDLKPVAQVLGMYILAENPQGMYIIDQHAAHERILFERFHKQFCSRTVMPMPLLVPITRELSPFEKPAFEKSQESFTELGFEWEWFGESSLILRGVPDIWRGQPAETLAMELLDECLQDPGRQGHASELLENRIITKACKAAIKANQWLSMPEMKALCSGLDELDDPFHCPHGRPILLHFSHYDLEKQFKRVM